MLIFAYYGYIQRSRRFGVYCTVRNGGKLQEIPLGNKMGERLRVREVRAYCKPDTQGFL
ncbi:MAG: hypothetical protein ACI81T_002680, partial [Bacteroidia bacterium]